MVACAFISILSQISHFNNNKIRNRSNIGIHSDRLTFIVHSLNIENPRKAAAVDIVGANSVPVRAEAVIEDT